MISKIKKTLLLLIVVLGFQNYASAKETICLNMIVKDETPVIRRCLESVKPIIDYWIIVDTGSTDGTQKMIKEFMKDIPGELKESPWVNFEHNRNEALQYAKGKADYILIIDADEQLVFEPNFQMPKLDKDFYFIETCLGGMKYLRTQLVKNVLPWKWEGVVHEALNCPYARTVDTLLGVNNIPRPDGNRSQDPLKFHKDAAVLEADLLKNPNNSRNVFYLAQSYKDAQVYEKAILNYEKRIAMGGWDQEVFWSMLQIGIIQECMGKSDDVVIAGYKRAHEYRPSRAEPLYRLANYFRNKENYQEAYHYITKGLALPKSTDILFVENWIYDYGMLLEYSIAAYWKELYIEALVTSKLMLTNPLLPGNFKTCVENNLEWIYKKLQEKV